MTATPGTRATPDGVTNAGTRVRAAVSEYLLALVVPRLTTVVVIPFVAHALTPYEFGVLALVMGLVSFATALVDLGLGRAAQRFAADREPASRARPFEVLFLLRATSGGVLLAAALACARPLAMLLTGQATDASLVRLAGFVIFVSGMNHALADWLRFEERHRAVAVLIASLTVIENAALVSLVVVLRQGTLGALAARATSETAGLLGLGALLVGSRPWRRATPPSDAARGVGWRPLAREMIGFGLPIMFLLLVGSLRDVDRFVISRIGSLSDVGGYDLASRCVAPVGLLNIALALTLEPYAYKSVVDERAAREVPRFVRRYAVAIGIAAFVTALLAPEILRIVAPPSYLAAATAVPALLFADVADGVRRIIGIVGDLSKRTALWAVSAIVQLAIALPLTIAFVPRVGIDAAALSLLAGTSASALVIAAMARRVHPVRVGAVGPIAVLVTGALVTTVAVGGLGSTAWPAAVRVVLAVGTVVVAGGAAALRLRRTRRA